MKPIWAAFLRTAEWIGLYERDAERVGSWRGWWAAAIWYLLAVAMAVSLIRSFWVPMWSWEYVTIFAIFLLWVVNADRLRGYLTKPAGTDQN